MSLTRLIGFLSSGPVLAGLLISLAFGSFSIVYLQDLNFIVAAEVTAIRVYYVLLLLLLGLRSARSFRKRAFGPSVAIFGLILVLLQAVYIYGFRFSGSIALGMNEETAEFETMEAGHWMQPGRIPLILKDARTESDASCTLLLDGQEMTLSKGQSFRWRGLKATVNGIYTAPLFILEDTEGKELDAGYIKLHLDRTGEDMFQFMMIPHRFFVSPADQVREHWKKEEQGWVRTEIVSGTPPSGSAEGYRLHIMRGKLNVIDRLVRPGERVEFEGFVIRFEDGMPWVKIGVEKIFDRYLLYTGAAFIVLGCIMGFRKGKRV